MGCNCKKLKKGDDIPLELSKGYIQLNLSKKDRIIAILKFIFFISILLPLIAFNKLWKKVTELKQM